MGIRRVLLAPVAVAAVGLVGTACEPTPMELTLGVSRQGTYEFVPSEPGSVDPGGPGVRLTGTIACTRSTEVTVLPTVRPAQDLFPGLEAVLHAVPIQCDGPGGNGWTHLWRLDSTDDAFYGVPLTARVTVDAQSAPDVDAVSVTRDVTLAFP